MSQEKDLKESKKVNVDLEVVFILDITGSMSSQIEGVKKMISKFCEIDRPGVNVHIWTFTENDRQCYVTHSPLGIRSNDLVQYAENIKLGCPPGHPNVSASGGDGPENLTAAVYSLTEVFSDKENVLAFVITDDTPHHIAFSESPEARAEKKWLTEHKQQNHDIFSILNDVTEQLNITFVPVLYSSAKQNRWFHQAAVLSQGLVLAPKSTDSAVLAQGLGSILETLQQLSVYRQVDLTQLESTAKMCHGYSVLIPEQELDILTEDQLDRNSLTVRLKELSSKDELKASLLGLLETTFDRFSGKKAGKRCRNINPKIIVSSIRVLIYSLLDLTGSKLHNEQVLNKEFNNLLEILDSDFVSDNIKHEKSLVNRFIEERNNFRVDLASINLSSLTELQPVQCMITLESALDYLTSLEQVPSTENEISQWMEIVLQLTMCRLISVSFPLDVYGKPDFADAWSAQIRQFELSSVLTASSAVKLRDQISGVYKDPVSRRDNNGAVILAHPNDSILSLVYKCLTSLHSLHGLVQSYLISGGIKIFPSIVAGIQSSCLIHLLRNSNLKYLKDNELELSDKSEFSQAEWEVVRCILWSLRQSQEIPARSVYNSLKERKSLNPADNVSKLIAGLIAFTNRQTLNEKEKKDLFLRLFEELSGDFVAYTNRLNEKNEKQLDYLIKDQELVGAFVKSQDNFDPLTQLHESEKLIKKISYLNLDNCKNTLGLLSVSKGFKYVTSLFYSICDLLEYDLKCEDFKKCVRPKRYLSIEELGKVFMESFILKKRTNRYVLNDQKEWIYLNNRVELETKINECLLNSIEDLYNSKIKEWNCERNGFAKKELFKKAFEINEKSIEDCSSKLKDLTITVVDKKYTLGRIDAIEAIQNMSRDKLTTLGAAFSIGDWTSEPPSQLRRHRLVILPKFNDFVELKEKIQIELGKIMICNREFSNRHGHSKFNIYPGTTNWTQDYEDKRLLNCDKPNIRASLKRMKEFTQLMQEIKNERSNMHGLKFDLVGKLFQFDLNHNDFERVKRVFQILKENTEIDDFISKEKIAKITSLRRLKNILDP